MRNMQVSENFERFATFSRASSVFISFFYFLRPFDDKILQGDILINIYTFKGRPRDCKSTWTEQSGNLKIATVKFSCRRSDQTLSDQAADRKVSRIKMGFLWNLMLYVNTVNCRLQFFRMQQHDLEQCADGKSGDSWRAGYAQ